MKVIRFESPIHYILESDQRTAGGELISRITVTVLRYGGEAEPIYYCLSCHCRDCYHVTAVRHHEQARTSQESGES